MEINEDVIWKMIDVYFRDNPQGLVRHHIESYDDFLDDGLSQIFRETNPLKLDLDYDETLRKFRSSAHIYFGGKGGKKIYYGKPVIYDDQNNIHYMFPNEARLRNMTYAIPIYVDLEIDVTRILQNLDDATDVDAEHYKYMVSEQDRTPSQMRDLISNIRETISENNVQTYKIRPIRRFICNLPIMVQSKYCVLRGLPRESRFALGECKNDIGGYFIIDGKEKTVICQEKFGDNMLYVKKFEVKPDEPYLYSADIRSVSENVSKPVRTISIKLLAPTNTYSNQNLVIFIPNMKKKAVPLFILFRALGIISDREIISMCLLKDPTDENAVSSDIIDWFLPSIHDAAYIQTQQDALEYLSLLLINNRTVHHVLHILADFVLPHVGEMNFREKAFFLGHMVNRLWAVSNGLELPTDRDNYKYKRVELVGSLMKDLFREYLLQYESKVRVKFETKYELNKETFKDISTLITHTCDDSFEPNLVQDGIKKAFKGNWGASQYTKRIGVVQDLNRLSNNGVMCHLRKTNLPLDSSVKLVGPRILHSSQWGIIDPIDTPDGANIGIHKYLAILTYITRNHSRESILEWIQKHTPILLLQNSNPSTLGKMTKVFVNGYWAGCIAEPTQMVTKMRECRRHALIPISTSIAFDITRNSIFIYTDGGRLCRPIFYRDEITHQFPFEDHSHWNSFVSKLMNESSSKYDWNSLISGFHEKKDPNFDPTKEKVYEWNQLYNLPVDKIKENKAVLDYLDSNEAESALIALSTSEPNIKERATHYELHESTLYGVMCNQINYLEHNPVTRNSFSCGQSKQACSLYHTNYTFRMDKTAVVLNYGKIPLVKSRYMKYINNEENPYGENAIVAIMCYTGYNVEDAILINEGALKRGLFRTTYYSTYEAHEEKDQKGDSTYLKTFNNIESLISENAVVGTKPGYDYSQLDEFGLIRENTEVDEKTVLIGATTCFTGSAERKDESKTPKKGQLGFVDKAFMTEGEEGQRIAKIRIREERIPAMGDKMASRAGQKGTIGMIIPESDMPFTKDGIRPDLIVNPHALPSRMTIGQIVECISGKACAHFGAFADCTPFVNLQKNMVGFFGELLTKMKFHSSGNEIMYDGFTGEQVEAEIFMGPTYYMRLKHMVKDKINFRARGPRTNLTRQTVSGRANDGGLRIGEMERDAVISHGTSHFLSESMMERGDMYHMAVCNKTGMIAVYNPNKNLLYSPMADGPIQYTGSLADGTTQIHQLSKFGRDFSIVAVPYSFKLLMQELLAINVRMSLITEDNISQIENMGFSNSLDKILFQTGTNPKNVIDVIKTKLENQKNTSLENTYSNEVLIPTSPDFPPPAFTSPSIPTSPDFPPPDYLAPALENQSVPPSPDYPPPDYSPPSSKDKIITGGKVHYRGDSNPSRIWTVQHVGDQFMTIDTDNLNGLNVEDSVRVVKPEEIYNPNDSYLYSVPYVSAQQMNPMMSENNIMLNPQPFDSVVSGDPFVTLNPNEPKINFAPVIKIFNEGNDMSQGNEPTHLAPSSPKIIGGNPNVIPTMHSKENTTPTANIENANSPIDFNKMVIKKLGS